MCDTPKRKKYLDEPYIPPHHDQGYRTEAPMTAARAVPASSYDTPIAKPEPPQYAEFETGKKTGGDELPAMPSWEGAGSKKVALEEEAVELEQLKKPEIAQNAPLMAPGSMSSPASPNPMSMRGNSPYGAPGQNMSNGYMPATRGVADPYAMNGMGQQQQQQQQQQGYNNYGSNGYGQMSRDNVNQGYDQGYGNSAYGNQAYDNQGYGNQAYGEQSYGAAATAAAAPMGQGRRTPHQDYNNAGYRRGPTDQGYPQSRTPRPYDEYGRSMTPRTGTPRSGTPGSGYGRPPPRRSPAPPNAPYGNPDRMRSPAPQQAGQQAGYGYDQRSNTSNGYGRQYPPVPSRQYSSDSAQPLTRPEQERQYTDTSYQQATPSYQQEPAEAQSPISNSGGFDFTSGYSRPQTSSSSPPPQQATGGGSAYPGYRAYKPQQ
ncbi:hypothetical protein SUNI508_06209 [Seiridium unicorne]|uniref:Uncharacterized protein n=1 Tax=Seiridium unicorne TaxID=138068 RepID=A0ABR2V398_9PEZI